MKHTVIRSKMKKGKPLLDDPIISRYVPETHWYKVRYLHRMLRTYSTVYIKPDKGRRGNGVIRVKRLNDSESEITYKHSSQRCSTKHLNAELKKILHPQKKYIIQQGIDMATYNHRPFDVRVVLQKILGRWHLSWISAKVAPRKTSIVTNVAKGAQDVKIIKTLQGIDQPLNILEVQRELIDASYQIAQILGSHFPFNIVGLDMSIDKKGKIWFIEANTKPDFRGLRKLDRNQYQKYIAAKKLMGKR